MEMQLSDFGIIFSGGMVSGIVLMAMAHLIGVVIHVFKKMIESR